MLVLEGKGAAADAEAFRAAGIGDFDVFDFEREGKRPGRLDREGRVLARVRAGHDERPTPASSPASSTIRRISGIRRSRQHANGVTGVAGVVFVAENPADHHVFLKAFSGVSDLQVDLERHHDRDAARRDPGDGPGGVPAAFRGRAAGRRRAACGLRRSALRCATSGCAREQRSARAPQRADGQARCVGPQAAHGATLVFER